MPSSSPLAGDALLDAVSARMAALHEHYHGRAPATANTRMLGDDLLLCVLGRIYSEVEKTVIELERAPLVHEVRSTFQQAMKPRFVAEVERLTGRRVVTFISTHHVGPDIEVELFFLGPKP